jgi:dyslexia susceptibility 1 candidate gene 1 protein
LRESNKPEEDAWLQKQAAARKRVEYANGDLTEQDKEDGYLEGKAAKMIKNGDYQSAINALNIASKMFPRKPRYKQLQPRKRSKLFVF